MNSVEAFEDMSVQHLESLVLDRVLGVELFDHALTIRPHLDFRCPEALGFL